MDYSELVKNTTAYKILDNDVLSGNLSHAYMFVSNDKLFLESLQKAVLCRIFCKEKTPCLNCTECLRVLNKSHPDAAFYPKGAKKINVEEVSGLIEDIYLKPFEREFKVFVLNGAEEINAQAQNKLLKILEEPPKNTHLLLFCKNKFNILNTVLSRVKLIETPPFSSEIIYSAVKGESSDLDLVKMAALNSFGSLERAKELIENDNFKNLINFCYSLCGISSPNDLNIIAKFNDFKDNLSDILNILQLIFRDLLMLKNGSHNLVNQSDNKRFDEIESSFSEKALIKLIEAVNNCNFKIKFNCNSQAVFDILCLDIIKAKQNLI